MHKNSLQITVIGIIIIVFFCSSYASLSHTYLNTCIHECNMHTYNIQHVCMGVGTYANHISLCLFLTSFFPLFFSLSSQPPFPTTPFTSEFAFVFLLSVPISLPIYCISFASFTGLDGIVLFIAHLGWSFVASEESCKHHDWQMIGLKT